MDDMQKSIEKFMKREKEEAEKAIRNEKKLVSIDPNTYVAKEIKYQTALLQRVLEEICLLKTMIKKNEEQSPSLRKKFLIFKRKR